MSQEFCHVTQSVANSQLKESGLKECSLEHRHKHVLDMYLGQLHARSTLFAEDTVSRSILEFLLSAISGFTTCFTGLQKKKKTVPHMSSSAPRCSGVFVRKKCHLQGGSHTHGSKNHPGCHGLNFHLRRKAAFWMSPWTWNLLTSVWELRLQAWISPCPGAMIGVLSPHS